MQRKITCGGHRIIIIINAAGKTLIENNGQRSYTDQGTGVQKEKKLEWTRRVENRIAEKRVELGRIIASEEGKYHRAKCERTKYS